MGTGEPSPLAPRDRRGRDRPARLEIWARAVLAVALLAFASVSLSARRGLDWGDLENRPDVAWAQLLLGGI
ncbi:MAG: hypothetical protein ACXWLI_12260, partial [Myxococcaceae bacterium]